MGDRPSVAGDEPDLSVYHLIQSTFLARGSVLFLDKATSEEEVSD